MELFTMTPSFLPDELLDGYNSAIWTERFFTAGDCQIVVPASVEWRNRLREGKFLGLKGSKEVMILENHAVDKGLLTVTGKTLDEFFKNRQFWYENGSDEEGQQSTKAYELTTKPGLFLQYVLERSVINPATFTTWPLANLDWAREKMENLTIGEITGIGLTRPREMSSGPLLDGIRGFATQNGIGFRVYLDWATEDDYSLVFAAWAGQDRTSQSDNPLVRLSPNLNSLMDTKEVLSIEDYKNVVYVHYKNKIYTFYAEPTLPIPEGFGRRSFIRMAEGDVADADLAAYIAQHAADAFANNNYIRAIDGEAAIPSQYRYQRDYRLGDIIELEGLTGLLTKARVTEYIRSEDQLGNKEYPTISVVDPLDSGNLPSLDPGYDFEPDEPWDPDPDPDPDPEPEPDDPPYPPDDGPGDGPGGSGQGTGDLEAPYPPKPPPGPGPDPDPDLPGPPPTPPGDGEFPPVIDNGPNYELQSIAIQDFNINQRNPIWSNDTGSYDVDWWDAHTLGFVDLSVLFDEPRRIFVASSAAMFEMELEEGQDPDMVVQGVGNWGSDRAMINDFGAWWWLRNQQYTMGTLPSPVPGSQVLGVNYMMPGPGFNDAITLDITGAFEGWSGSIGELDASSGPIRVMLFGNHKEGTVATGSLRMALYKNEYIGP